MDLVGDVLEGDSFRERVFGLDLFSRDNSGDADRCIRQRCGTDQRECVGRFSLVQLGNLNASVDQAVELNNPMIQGEEEFLLMQLVDHVSVRSVEEQDNEAKRENVLFQEVDRPISS